MKIKVLFLLLTSLLSHQAVANGMIVVRPNEINSSCRDSNLVVAIKPLTQATRSRTHIVTANTQNLGLCEAARKYLQFDKPIRASFATRVDKVDYLVKANPCFPTTMETCSAIYREAMLETIKVKVNALELSNRVEIPGTQRDHLVQWDPQFCPPYYPDCDL